MFYVKTFVVFFYNNDYIMINKVERLLNFDSVVNQHEISVFASAHILWITISNDLKWTSISLIY